MKNLFSFVSFVCVLALASAPVAVFAQVKPAPLPRTAIAAETAAPAPSTPAPATTTAAEQEEEDAPNVVLFTGTVKQEKLKALPGAIIYVKSTRQMAVADENGDFSMELDFSRGSLDLEVSYAGFADQSVTITDPNTFLVVSMQNKKKK